MDEGWLRGKRVAVTGRLVSMTHADFAELVAARGGEFVPLPNRGTSALVIGQEGVPLEADGRQTVSLARARKLRSFGYDIELLAEEEFYGRLELTAPQTAIHRRCTINQLSRLLSLPGRKLRSWMRAGLIEPVEVVHRLAYFDFGQVASAKNLCELTSAGVRPQQIRESLEQLRNSLPSIDIPLAQLSLMERDGRLLLRLDDDRLVEPSGQLHFDFVAGDFETGDFATGDFARGSADEPEIVAFDKPVEAWFEDALDCEDRGRPMEAAAAYREALRLEPHDPVLHFNLGNALFAGKKTAAAAEHFRQAVGYDPCYAEAWNNLGNVLDALEDFDAAIGAYQRALQLVPGYADAHYNLAQTLVKLGRDHEAERHVRAYLQIESDSDAGVQVRAPLARLSVPPLG